MPKQFLFSLLLAAFSSFASARPKVLVFDVFGTCVDYQGSILAEGAALNSQHGWQIDWDGLESEWVGAETAGVAAVREGEIPWMNLDAILSDGLAERLARYGGPPADEWQQAELNNILGIWHRLRPWPDTLPGLNRLHSHFRLAALSNGNRTLLQDMALHSALPWDEIFSGEDIHHYKPDAEVYRHAIDALAIPANQIMLVASHRYDLAAAARAGMQTAFIPRAGEPEIDLDFKTPEMRFDYQARSLSELADLLLR